MTSMSLNSFNKVNANLFLFNSVTDCIPELLRKKGWFPHTHISTGTNIQQAVANLNI